MLVFLPKHLFRLVFARFFFKTPISLGFRSFSSFTRFHTFFLVFLPNTYFARFPHFSSKTSILLVFSINIYFVRFSFKTLISLVFLPKHLFCPFFLPKYLTSYRSFFFQNTYFAQFLLVFLPKHLFHSLFTHFSYKTPLLHDFRTFF